MFLAEGLSSYLTHDQNADLLDCLASMAAPGSVLGIDMISRDYLDNPAVAPFLDLLGTQFPRRIAESLSVDGAGCARPGRPAQGSRS